MPRPAFKLTAEEEPESSIQDGVKKALLRHPAVAKVFRVNCGWGRRGERLIQFHDIEGMTDLLVCLKPRYGAVMGFVETKKPKEKPRPDQFQFMTAMWRRGHIVFVAISADQAYQEFDRQLAELAPAKSITRAPCGAAQRLPLKSPLTESLLMKTTTKAAASSSKTPAKRATTASARPAAKKTAMAKPTAAKRSTTTAKRPTARMP